MLSRCLLASPQIRVVDDGLLSDSVIGGVDVPLAELMASDGTAWDSGQLWFPLLAQPNAAPVAAQKKSAAPGSAACVRLQVARVLLCKSCPRVLLWPSSFACMYVCVQLRFVLDPAPSLRLPQLDAASGVLTLLPMSASDLKNVQMIGKQDPYVSVSLWPARAPGKGDAAALTARTKPAVDSGTLATWKEPLRVRPLVVQSFPLPCPLLVSSCGFLLLSVGGGSPWLSGAVCCL